MAALQISISFMVTVMIASSLLVFSDIGPPSSRILPQSLDEKARKAHIAFPSEARLCSHLATLDPDENASTPHIASFAGGVYREIRARDLPGIVKLEPERDLDPYEVSKGHCSATRIATNWFVTAAHCVSNDYDRINLRTGSESLSSNDIRTVPVDFAICHAGFTGRNNLYDNDLSLLYVSNNRLGDLARVPVISWGMTGVPFTKARFHAARVGGWGLKSFGGELNDHLQKMELDIVQIDDKTIRLGSRAGRGPCIGDSGGPLIVEDEGKPVLMGVLSTISANSSGEMCEGRYVSNYTNLTSYQPWILNTVMTCNADIEVCRKG